ncbi:hypothetical protein MSG28_014656 [Choristoneura fumiferana]|uniref:Uncharacterized protein n=1 Tax=Choristoneura fumiferana TaxID=7141 RepID=A0ACC0JS52_CHOFU|nr:hypothetical protein MSG28_014656 [Choristoneura fumiferana]
MSSGAVENKQEPAHIAGVDVDASTGVDGSECELSCDSGLESKSSCLIEAVVAPDTTLSPSKSVESGIKLDIKMDSADVQGNETPPSLSHSSASSPGANTSENFSNLDDFLSSHIEVTNDEDKAINLNITDTSNNNDNAIVVMLNQSETSSNDSVDQPDTYLEANKSLATSTVSLHEATNTNITICKSPYSRSAENISIDIKTDQSIVDKDTILSQFKSQKNKVSATQVITPDSQTTLDVRYPRIPKEILSQDIGSIVKNVHGIFSSVSGSLKSAYTYRTGQMPYMKTVKPMTNGKLMKDIFEDEQNDEKVNNGIDALKAEPNVNESEIIDENKPILNVEESNVKGDVLRLQIESLERVLGEQRRENSVLRERVKQQADELQERDQTFKELEVKMDMMSKRVEQAEREKDAAVMRYASVECSAIEARRAADVAAKAEKAAVAEAELLNNKIKAAREDKQRICQLYDDKCHELQNCDRELLKVREDVKELEGRLKWTQSKLRMEMDAYKDSAERVEKLTAQVSELEAARDAAAANATDSLRAKQLESELKESQAALILCRHEREDLGRRLAAVTLQSDASRAAKDAASAALAALTAEVVLIIRSIWPTLPWSRREEPGAKRLATAGGPGPAEWSSVPRSKGALGRQDEQPGQVFHAGTIRVLDEPGRMCSTPEVKAVRA